MTPTMLPRTSLVDTANRATTTMVVEPHPDMTKDTTTATLHTMGMLSRRLEEDMDTITMPSPRWVVAMVEIRAHTTRVAMHPRKPEVDTSSTEDTMTMAVVKKNDLSDTASNLHRNTMTKGFVVFASFLPFACCAHTPG